MILPAEPPPSRARRFAIGQLVSHRRYGTRGVIVAADDRCRADESWYMSNQTQPARDQPWYHVLVDGAAHSTYVAQENLAADELAEPIRHPLVPMFFESFEDGRYRRNDEPWQA